jgi:hypothetical protein
MNKNILITGIVAVITDLIFLFAIELFPHFLYFFRGLSFYGIYFVLIPVFFALISYLIHKDNNPKKAVIDTFMTAFIIALGFLIFGLKIVDSIL